MKSQYLKEKLDEVKGSISGKKKLSELRTLPLRKALQLAYCFAS